MDYEKALEKARSAYGTGAYDDTTLEFLFPELKESEDERIRKSIIECVKEQIRQGNYLNINGDKVISYLEKQKEQSKEELVYRLNGLMQDYIKEGKDEEEKEHRFKCYKLFWDALEDAEFFEQKEQKPAEWSEEDEDMLNSCISSIEEAKENRYVYKETDGDTSYDHEIDWLKSLRPHWKPSEEQMEAFRSYIKDFQEKAEAAVGGWNNFDVMIRLFEQLKAL